MAHTLTKGKDIFRTSKFGIDLAVFPNFGDCGLVLVETERGHTQEFLHKKSSFNYIILEGSGTFFLDDKAVSVEKGDVLSIQPNTRIYYKGKMKFVLVTNPAWTEEDEVETKPQAW